MTPKHFVAVCLRLFALWLIISGLHLFFAISALKAFNTEFGHSSIWIFASICSAFLLLAFMIWIFSAPLATGLLSGVARPTVSSLSLSDIIVAGCVFSGLWWLKEALFPFVMLWFKAIAQSDQSHSAFETLDVNGKIDMAIYLAEIAAGLFFVSRPFTVAGWVVRRDTALQAHANDHSG